MNGVSYNNVCVACGLAWLQLPVSCLTCLSQLDHPPGGGEFHNQLTINIGVLKQLSGAVTGIFQFLNFISIDIVCQPVVIYCFLWRMCVIFTWLGRAVVGKETRKFEETA